MGTLLHRKSRGNDHDGEGGDEDEKYDDYDDYDEGGKVKVVTMRVRVMVIKMRETKMVEMMMVMTMRVFRLHRWGPCSTSRVRRGTYNVRCASCFLDSFTMIDSSPMCCHSRDYTNPPVLSTSF